MGTVTKREISEHIARKLGRNQQVVKTVIDEFMSQVINELSKANKLEFRDFGIFEVLERKPRVARNPRTGARVEVPAKRRVGFRMGRLMRERVSPAEPAPVLQPNPAPAPSEGPTFQ